ncbi:hypothetical protein HanRHA438_Chr07g0315401 [Helianthus annuus]|nr:hypothetical protein HanRHA438_Chr07g0315401 [Helianthus annuus]
MANLLSHGRSSRINFNNRNSFHTRNTEQRHTTQLNQIKLSKWYKTFKAQTTYNPSLMILLLRMKSRTILNTHLKKHPETKIQTTACYGNC